MGLLHLAHNLVANDHFGLDQHFMAYVAVVDADIRVGLTDVAILDVASVGIVGQPVSG